MLEPEEQAMGKERKSALEIIDILYQILSEEPQSIGKIAERSKSQGNPIGDATAERYLKLISFIQDKISCDGLVISYKEETIAGRTYKSAWLTKNES